MSKQPIDSISSHNDDDLPPPYTASDGPFQSEEQSTVPAPSVFTSQLSNLRGLVHSQQAARASAQEQQDSQVLAILVPHLEDFISSIATFNPIPTRAEAILIPSGAVSDEWELSDEQETRAGEIRQVIHAQRHDKLRSDAKGASKAAYGAWSSDSEPSLWWTDETMARRLARHLTPDTHLPQRTTAVKEAIPPPRQEKKTSRWKLFSRDSPAELSSSASRAPATPSRTNPEDVTMTTKAEEITFRRENEFGIWESKTGWGIVVQVRLPRS